MEIPPCWKSVQWSAGQMNTKTGSIVDILMNPDEDQPKCDSTADQDPNGSSP